MEIGQRKVTGIAFSKSEIQKVLSSNSHSSNDPDLFTDEELQRLGINIEEKADNRE